MPTPTAALRKAQVEFDDPDLVRQVFGLHDANLHILERLSGVACHARGTSVTLEGEAEEVRFGARVLGQLYDVARRGIELSSVDVERVIRTANRDSRTDIAAVLSEPLFVTAKGRQVLPKSTNQKAYVDAIRDHDLVFGIGPAGTGKTYLAMVMALKGLLARRFRRIVLCRPAVEAGERLGFLPGDLAEKINPYLRPLYDALNDLVDFERSQQLLGTGTIEVAPLAFMRGRTLNDAFVILDEAQNATSEQMKMFLTRLGFESKAVVTGDVTQVDLPSGQRCGLTEAAAILHDIAGIRFCTFTEVDVVRHPLVQEIVLAYDRHDARPGLPGGDPGAGG